MMTASSRGRHAVHPPFFLSPRRDGKTFNTIRRQELYVFPEWGGPL